MNLAAVQQIAFCPEQFCVAVKPQYRIALGGLQQNGCFDCFKIIGGEIVAIVNKIVVLCAVAGGRGRIGGQGEIGFCQFVFRDGEKLVGMFKIGLELVRIKAGIIPGQIEVVIIVFDFAIVPHMVQNNLRGLCRMELSLCQPVHRWLPMVSGYV